MTTRRRIAAAVGSTGALAVVALSAIHVQAAPEPAAPQATPATPSAMEFVFPERTYRFETPPRGRRTVTDLGGGRIRVELADESGRPVAQGLGNSRRFDEVTFYDANAQGATLTIPILYDEAPDRPAGANQNSRVSHAFSGRTGVKREHASCGLNSQNPFPYSWPVAQTFNYYIVTSSIPGNVDQATAIQHVRNGHVAWILNDNYCAIADQSNISFQYQGSTTVSAGQNNVNTVGWGNPQLCGAATSTSSQPLACSPTWTVGNTVVEADIRYNVNRSWVTSGAGGSGSCTPCDIWGVATHEVGHQIGFNHVSDNDNVMSTGFETGAESTTARRLGRGDANMNNARY